ncbi:di-heme-cytochrome C peroxidase [Coralliovum pocilloporae]|uniref:di-heme-cytochrome C peroxidase n=1 Tax=Coralliovum pocilloporae TaxID=3066369 RepID=UPI003307AD76
MLSRLLYRIFLFLSRHKNVFKYLLILAILIPVVSLIASKLYQNFGDQDADRGAIAMTEPDKLGERFSTPIYLKDHSDRGGYTAQQGWNNTDSLWFYNTTQGSALLPYDFFLALEEAGSDRLLSSNEVMNDFRYLPQKPTPFNPDGLAVGFVKTTYLGEYKWYQMFNPGKDYVGYTCAACHTGQINYTKDPEKPAVAIRIDGGPAMADMVGFLDALEKAMKAAQSGPKRDKFIERVLARNNDYSSAEEVDDDLKKWTGTVENYNYINHSSTEYGFSRLDAFGRIYNRVLQYVISTEQAREVLADATLDGERILDTAQLDVLFDGIESDDIILGDRNFALILSRLKTIPLSSDSQIALRDAVFNEANAPVSYPFLWDIAQSDYVQWNGLASNAGIGPLGRNTGEVIGVFGILDWKAEDRWMPSLSAYITGQKNKKKHVTFDSSVDISNLQRLERKLRSLKSPVWPEDILGSIDWTKAQRGRLIYNQYCLGCHEVIDRNNADRLAIAKMSNIELIGTDPVMAENSVNYTGQSGNFKHTRQEVDSLGHVVVDQDAPVIQLLTWAARGVIATPDPDKWFFRRWAERIYNLVASKTENPIEPSMKAGNYLPDTTSSPYASLLSYKARPLNGIWATAPYLHNGSVPTLYDLLLPAKREGDPEYGEYRPDIFAVGWREFDPKHVGFKGRDIGEAGKGYTLFNTADRGNSNRGHEYGGGLTPQADGETVLKALNRKQRLDLLEYLKTL